MLETFVGVPGVIFAMSFRYVKDILLNESEKLFDVVYAQVNTLSDMSHVAYSFIFELLYGAVAARIQISSRCVFLALTASAVSLRALQLRLHILTQRVFLSKLPSVSLH